MSAGECIQFYGFQIFLKGTVGRGGGGYRLFIRGVQLALLAPNLHPGDCLLRVHSFLWFPNLPLGDCRPGV